MTSKSLKNIIWQTLSCYLTVNTEIKVIFVIATLTAMVLFRIRIRNFIVDTSDDIRSPGQGVPQPQIAVLPRHQEEDKTSANRTNVRKALRLALSFPSEVIAMFQ